MSRTSGSDCIAESSTRGRVMRCITTMDGGAISCDRAWESFTGVDASRLRSSGWSLVVHRDDLARLDDARRESARIAHPFEVDVRVRRHDGSYRWCQFAAEPVREGKRGRGEGAPGRWIVRVVDVDRHKRAQERLEQLVRAREESLAAFAHDLRNPVQTMRHALFALTLEGAAPETRPQMLSVLERQVELLTSKTHEYLHALQRDRRS